MKHVRRKISAGVDGGLSGGSSVQRPGSEDLHHGQRNSLMFGLFMLYSSKNLENWFTEKSPQNVNKLSRLSDLSSSPHTHSQVYGQVSHRVQFGNHRGKPYTIYFCLSKQSVCTAEVKLAAKQL